MTLQKAVAQLGKCSIDHTFACSCSSVQKEEVKLVLMLPTGFCELLG